MNHPSFSWKKLGLALLYPHPIITILLIPVSGVLLWLSFAYFGESSPVSAVSYAIAAYTLMVACLRGIPFGISVYRRLKNNRLTGQLMEDRELRARLSLYSSLAFNTAYGLFNIIAGGVIPPRGSGWLFSLGVYYVALAIIRFSLFKTVRASIHATSEKERLQNEQKKYRFAGWSLLFLNIAISGMILQMIAMGRGFSYPGMLIFVFAAYTFIKLTATIVNIVKLRKLSSPVLSASKAIDLAVSLISMFCLQTAMFASFGEGMTLEDQQTMNMATGIGVGVGLLLIALYMIISSSRKIKIKAKEQNESNEELP